MPNKTSAERLRSWYWRHKSGTNVIVGILVLAFWSWVYGWYVRLQLESRHLGDYAVLSWGAFAIMTYSVYALFSKGLTKKTVALFSFMLGLAFCYTGWYVDSKSELLRLRKHWDHTGSIITMIEENSSRWLKEHPGETLPDKYLSSLQGAEEERDSARADLYRFVSEPHELPDYYWALWGTGLAGIILSVFLWALSPKGDETEDDLAKEHTDRSPFKNLKIEEGRGDTFDDAIVLKGTQEGPLQPIQYWIVGNKYAARGAYAVESRTVREIEGRTYELFHIRLSNGAEKRVYFDVTDFHYEPKPGQPLPAEHVAYSQGSDTHD